MDEICACSLLHLFKNGVSNVFIPKNNANSENIGMQSKMFACLSSPLKNLRTFLSVLLVESVGNIFASIPLLKYSKKCRGNSVESRKERRFASAISTLFRVSNVVFACKVCDKYFSCCVICVIAFSLTV